MNNIEEEPKEFTIRESEDCIVTICKYQVLDEYPGYELRLYKKPFRDFGFSVLEIGIANNGTIQSNRKKVTYGKIVKKAYVEPRISGLCSTIYLPSLRRECDWTFWDNDRAIGGFGKELDGWSEDLERN